MLTLFYYNSNWILPVNDTLKRGQRLNMRLRLGTFYGAFILDFTCIYFISLDFDIYESRASLDALFTQALKTAYHYDHRYADQKQN